MQNDPLHDRPFTPKNLPETGSDLNSGLLPVDDGLGDRSNRIVPLGVIVAISAVVLAAGSATAWWTWNTARTKAPTPAPIELPQGDSQPLLSPSPAVSASPTPQATTQPSAKPPSVTEQTVQVYWLKDVGDRLQLVPTAVTLQAAPQADATLNAAFEQLLKGPAEVSVASTIPSSTALRSLEVRQDGIHVDLSKDFTSGGGSASMTGRLAQVVYTATTLDPSAKVWLSVEGQPLDVLGGEGLLIDQPITRAIFVQNFPL